ncbi:Vms1/Ankzf1 family peptidyl-tRNA hydrolase [Intrasporangium calvum]|uniref:baeRF2 domain-containing protein n=1 Tax=Intrasporangium calvum TaxID=53358 RepID=UPI0012376E78|nr:Vms1/Ankzf1 family peptidyl-tRNA hydrolase [Intrasporangium calvum]
MQLDWLKPLADLEGPFACATLDASNLDPTSRSHRLASWGSARRELERAGADEATLAVLEDALTGDANGVGERTHVVCASNGNLVLDIGLEGRPRREGASFGPVPRLMDVVRGLDGRETYAVVKLDREGADIEVIDPTGALVAATDVTGEHDELRKVAAGGASQRRFQARAEDSWRHNATQVAAELDRLVRRVRPGVVFLEGEEHTTSYLVEQAPGDLADRIVRLDTGGRAAGTSAAAEATARDRELARLRAGRDALLVERFGDATGAGAAVEGWDAVQAALGKAQIAQVLLHPDVWDRDHPAEGPGADHDLDALLWSLAAVGAELSLVAQPFEAADGIGAILRWGDPSTPSA